MAPLENAASFVELADGVGGLVLEGPLAVCLVDAGGVMVDADVVKVDGIDIVDVACTRVTEDRARIGAQSGVKVSRSLAAQVILNCGSTAVYAPVVATDGLL